MSQVPLSEATVETPVTQARTTSATTDLAFASVTGARRISAAATTQFAADGSSGPADTETLPLDRAYPHLFDLTTASGKALKLVAQARNDASLALDAFSEADLETLATQLRLVAASVAKAHELADFNAAYGGALGFVRRACLAATAADLSRPALNALVQALQTLTQTPTLDLMNAAALVEKLEYEGWQGQHGVVDALVRALLDESSLDEAVQKELFDSLVGSARSTS